VHSRVATGAVTGSQAQFVGVVFCANEDLAGSQTSPRRLRVALEAEIIVPIQKHFRIDGTVRFMANGTTFPHPFVLEDVHFRLFAMTLRTGFVPARHGKAACRLHDVHPMRIVALRAIHLPLKQRMMLRQIKLHVRFQMARKARAWIFSGIYNELSPAARRDVTASRSVARFTT
jgi:hypothetical protein